MNIAVYLKIPPEVSGTACLMLIARKGNEHAQPPEDDNQLLNDMRSVRYLLHPAPVAFVLNRFGPSADDLNKAREELRNKGLIPPAMQDTQAQPEHQLAA